MRCHVSTAVQVKQEAEKHAKQNRRRVIIGSTIGTTIEFYDFYVYATAAVAVFPHLFFAETDNPTVALLQSFATFGLAFIVRPLGSVVFGHFGDRIGRKATLVGALLTMGIATFIIGLLPTYAQVGILAPALLALMRFCQGLGLGGEWSGAALLATESAEEGRRARAAMWPQLGAPFGFLLANGLFLIIVKVLGHDTAHLDSPFMVWGWRIPFILSSVMVAVGLWVRIRLDETPVFTKAVQQGKKAKAPFTEVFKVALGPVISGTFIMVGTYTLFYLVTTWILSYGIADREKGLGLGFEYQQFLVIQLISIFAFMVGIPLSGYWADRFGRKPTLFWSTVAVIVFGLTFEMFLAPDKATLFSSLVFLTIGMFAMGLIFGPMSAVLPELFPTNVRYTGSGLTYNAASILGAAIAPFIATWLNASFGVASVGYYLVAVSIVSLLAIALMRESRELDMTEI